MLSALRETVPDHSLEVSYSCVKQMSPRCGFPGYLLGWHLQGNTSHPRNVPITRRELKPSKVMGM